MRTTNLPRTPEAEREQALRWLIQNRRPDVSIEQAIRVLNMVLPRDRHTLLILRRIAEELTAESAAKAPFNWRTSLALPPRE